MYVFVCDMCGFVCFIQKTRYQAGMRNSENLTANNTFSKPTRYQVTTPFPSIQAWAEVDSTKTQIQSHGCVIPQEHSFIPSFIAQIFIGCLLYVRHCATSWGYR